MNCLLESVAGVYIGLHNQLCMRISDDPLQKAEDDLEFCKMQLEQRAQQLGVAAGLLCQDAVAKRKQGDTAPALQKFQEYKRCRSQLAKVTNGISLLNKQLDVLHSNDLDKQVMASLKQSSQAMRAAGIEGAAGEAEHVMVDIEEQVREASAFTSILAAPLESIEETEDLSSELDDFMADFAEGVASTPSVVSSMLAPSGVDEVQSLSVTGPSVRIRAGALG